MLSSRYGNVQCKAGVTRSVPVNITGSYVCVCVRERERERKRERERERRREKKKEIGRGREGEGKKMTVIDLCTLSYSLRVS